MSACRKSGRRGLEQVYYSAITKVNGVIKSRNLNLHRKRTICSCKLLVQYKDISVDWVPLKDLKHSNPVELAKYAMANEISDEPVFSWWAKETLRRQGRIISKVTSMYWCTSHKFEIQVYNTVEEAYDIDRKLGTDFWTKAIAK